MFDKIRQFFKNLFTIIDSFRDARNIARRMFVTNSFDSIFASLGVSIGAYEKNLSPFILGMSILGTSLTLGIFSSILAVYLSERNERIKELKKLEKELMVQLKGSIYYKSINILSLYISLWSGVGAFIFTILISIPYFILGTLGFGIIDALIVSLCIAFLELAYLGYYMAKISEEKISFNIAKNIILGLLAILVILLIKFILKI